MKTVGGPPCGVVFIFFYMYGRAVVRMKWLLGHVVARMKWLLEHVVACMKWL